MAIDSILLTFLLLGITNSMALSVSGFKPDIYEIFNEINYLLGSESNKQMLDEAMDYVTGEFVGVTDNLRDLETKLTEKERNVYHNLQEAVIGGINDVKSRITTEVGYKAVALNNQLNIISDGMLGVSTATPDLLESLNNLYSCGSKSMNVTMERVATLLNIGAVGISYYAKTFNDTEKFDGHDRMANLANKKVAILQRLQHLMKACATLEYPKINEHISKVLDVMQSESTTADVIRALYDRFADIYYPYGLSWAFYTVWNFRATDSAPADRRVQSAHMECLDNCGEFVKIADWSVYWAFARPTNPPAGPIQSVNIDAVERVVDDLKWVDPQDRSASIIEKRLRQYPIVTSDSRDPVFWLIVENPTREKNTGFPYPDTQQLNIKGHTYTSTWVFYEFFTGIPFPLSVTVDIIVL